MTDTITVRQNSRPTITRVLRDFRNEDDPTARVNIAAYAFQFIVKKNVGDPDSRALFDLAATILGGGTDGRYQFALTMAHTGFAPGRYVGEIRWWTDGDMTKPPSDAVSVDYAVEAAIDAPL